MKLLKKFSLVGFVFVLFFLSKADVNAQQAFESEDANAREETLEAKIVGVLEEKKISFDFSEETQTYQKLELLVTKGSLKDQKIIVENGNLPLANSQEYKVGDKVTVSRTKDLEGNEFFYITDYLRRLPLLWLFLIFAFLAVVVGRIRGVTSLLGMAASFGIIFIFILPQILSGKDPVLASIMGSFMIIPVTFYLSHGLNKKTTVAVLGTLISLIITGILAKIFVDLAGLTGFATEEAGFLEVARGGSINIKGMLLAGIIIGVLGVLDDITISQSAVVKQLKEINPKLKFEELYKRAMDVGQDHISSMVNTLVLVYTGASLPLLLLFIDNPHPFLEVINYEILADEIIRTLVGSIGLILAVPITTFIAVLAFERK